jgi:hypothetical protein
VTAPLEFSYAFAPDEDPRAVLRDARLDLEAVSGVLGATRGAAEDDAAKQAALRLLDELERNVAELTEAAPDLLPLAPDQFTASGLTPAPAIQAMAKDHAFYWLRIPYTLQTKADHRFERLEIAIELNPGDAALARPRILSALPTSKFVTLASADVELRVGIDEALQFAERVGAEAPATGAHVAANAAGKLGFVAGPFTYRVRKAEVEGGTLPSERTFWRITGTEQFEAPLELITVVAVPTATPTLRLAAALQAYASPQLLTMTLGAFFQYLGQKLRGFCSAGAPIRATRVWDLTPRLLR